MEVSVREEKGNGEMGESSKAKREQNETENLAFRLLSSVIVLQ